MFLADFGLLHVYIMFINNVVLALIFALILQSRYSTVIEGEQRSQN